MKLNKIQPFLILAIVSFALLFSFPGKSFAVDLTLSWDRPDDERVTGYKVFYGESGTDLLSMPRETIDSPDVTSLVIHDLEEGQHIGFSLKSIDAFGNERDFSDILYHLVASDDDAEVDIVIDNGDPGTSREGSWRISAGQNTYGNTSIYSIDPGATYTFETEVTGYHDVLLWWTYYPNRCTRVDVDIYAGNYLVASLEVDQQSDSGLWNTLGEHEFSGTARVVVHSSHWNCSTNVDGIRFIGAPFPEEGM